MPFDPRAFLGTARLLDVPHRQNPNEADLRTARGRAYYSAYLVARERLAGMGHHRPPGDQNGTHGWLLKRLRGANDDDVRSLGRRLGALFDGRVGADYDLQDQSGYSSMSGHNAAVKAEQWIRDFEHLSDAKLRTALRP